jgi:NADPH2:quinone reductase
VGEGREIAERAGWALTFLGPLDLVVHEVLPLEQAVMAHQKMEAGKAFGRIVLAPSG